MARVKNLNGTADNKAPAGYTSWLDYWKKEAGKNVFYCGCSDCFNPVEVGAHVRLADSMDGTWYIVPLCGQCNKKPSTEPFDVGEVLIPASK